MIVGFVGYLQIVTTNNYNTVTDFRTTEHSTPLFSLSLIVFMDFITQEL
jgi:hypothetical protein